MPKGTCEARAKLIAVPISVVMACASSSDRDSISSTIRCSSARRSSTELMEKVAKALRAAVTALSTSPAVPPAMEPMTASVAGLITAMAASEEGATHWPSM